MGQSFPDFEIHDIKELKEKPENRNTKESASA